MSAARLPRWRVYLELRYDNRVRLLHLIIRGHDAGDARNRLNVWAYEHRDEWAHRSVRAYRVLPQSERV